MVLAVLGVGAGGLGGGIRERKEKKRAALPADFECGRGHGRELGGDVEDAVEFAVGEGLRYGCGYAGYDSVVLHLLVYMSQCYCISVYGA